MGNSATKAKNKYNSANYDRLSVILPKGKGEEWKAEAKQRNLSLNAFIIEAIRYYLENYQNENEKGQDNA